jgi:HSP20 family molecular chaperone IbpA
MTFDGTVRRRGFSKQRGLADGLSRQGIQDTIMSTDLTPSEESTATPPNPSPVQEQLVFTPPIDIFETPDGLVLMADLPGVTPDTLELQVQDNKLTLFGRVTQPAPSSAKLIHQEYRVGHYLRSFILSDEVDHERITAKLTNGVLEVVLPRAAKSEPRRIQIRTE